MQLIPVESSNIKAIGHEGSTMRVQYANGTEYDFQGVTAEIFNNFMESDSKGRFFGKNIRGKFTSTKVGKDNKDGGTL